ncbi:MAG: SigE family RNA polymerase sigma factor [Actinomycetia bacterium]|nr:SigE family RNA polymerase sigma factor [Actinomycetes bacterium]
MRERIDDSSVNARVAAIRPPVESFDSFYRREYYSLVGLAYVLTGSHHASEDLVQLAFTEAHRKWDRVGSYDQPGAWLRRVLVNKSRSRFRRLGSEAKALTRIGNRRQDDIQPGERSTEVWAAVRQLPNRQAAVIALKYWEDLAIADIAKVLDCSTETVKTHLKRARATLSRQLENWEGA